MRALCKCPMGQMTNWPSISDFANLEKLHIGLQGFDQSLSHPLLRSVKSSCLRRVIPGVETGAVRWSSLDENLAGLVKREEYCRDLVLQISTTEGSWLASASSTGGRIRNGFHQVPRSLHDFSVLVTMVLGYDCLSQPSSRYFASTAQPTTPIWNRLPTYLPPLRSSPLPPPNHMIPAARDQDRIGRGYGGQGFVLVEVLVCLLYTCDF